MDAAGITNNRHTTLTAKDVLVQWEQYQVKITQSVSLSLPLLLSLSRSLLVSLPVLCFTCCLYFLTWASFLFYF